MPRTQTPVHADGSRMVLDTRVVHAAEYLVHLLQRVHAVIEIDVIVGSRIRDCALTCKADELFHRRKGRSPLSPFPNHFPLTQTTSHDQGDDESTLHGLSLDRVC